MYYQFRDKDNNLLLITGDSPPAGLSIQLPDLLSRLSYGLVLHIQDMSDEYRLETLKQHSNQRGFELPDAVGQ